jgi:hypothetical protein
MPTATPTSWAVPQTDGDGEARVERDGDEIVVQFVAGSTRRFSRDGLAATLANILATLAHDGVWLRDYDSNRMPFVVTVADGELYADVRVLTDDELAEHAHVSWEQLRAAMESALQKPTTRRTSS